MIQILKQYRKWFITIAAIWFALWMIFWSTAQYAYNGFLVSLIIIGIAAVGYLKFRKK